MILAGLQLDKAGEIARIDVTDWINVKLRGIEDQAGDAVIEIRRAWGSDGPVEAYSSPELLDLSGVTPTDLQTEDCSHLAIIVTTPGASGETFDLEWNTQGRIRGKIERVQIDLSKQGQSNWRRTLEAHERVASIIATVSESSGSPALSLTEYIDQESQAFRSGSITLDETSTSHTLGAITAIGAEVTTGSNDVIADLWIYFTSNIETTGLQRDGVAMLPESQEFTGFNLMSGGLAIGDLSTGIHTITSDASGNLSVAIPDEEGEFSIVSDPTPSDDEILVRSGDGYLSIPLAGSSFPTPTFDGQAFRRTDLDIPETFNWDANRSKWLGELRIYQLSRSSSETSGSLDLRYAGGVQFNNSRGILTPSRLTIVGAELFSAQSFTADLTLREGSSDLATLLSISSNRAGSDHTLNQDVDADSGWPQKYFVIDNISGGTVDNPIINILARRYES